MNFAKTQFSIAHALSNPHVSQMSNLQSGGIFHDISTKYSKSAISYLNQALYDVDYSRKDAFFISPHPQISHVG